MTIILLIVVAVAVCAPVACLVLVSIASLREDVAHSLGNQPAGAMQAATRRLLGFHGDARSERPGTALRTMEFIDNERGPGDSSRYDDPDLRRLVG